MLLMQLIAAAVLSAPVATGARMDSAGDDSAARKHPRPHAFEYTDAYYTRLRIHKVASYAELPMFAAEYFIGERLLKEERTGIPSQSLKGMHGAVALGLGALFTVNTVTGVWNLWDSRKDPNGRPLRLIHSALMLGADAGFALAGASGGNAQNNLANANHHRTIAVSSMALATAGTLMMWLLHN
jgi:hypothetical protein